MAFLDKFEEDTIKLVGLGLLVVLILVIAAVVLSLKNLPKLPSLSDLWKKLMDGLFNSGNVLGGTKQGSPDGASTDEGPDGIDPFQIHTGIGG